jgi:hypothetical protein
MTKTRLVPPVIGQTIITRRSVGRISILGGPGRMRRRGAVRTHYRCNSASRILGAHGTLLRCRQLRHRRRRRRCRHHGEVQACLQNIVKNHSAQAGRGRKWMTLAVQVRIPGVRRPGGNNGKTARRVSGPRVSNKRCLCECHQRACRFVDRETGTTRGRLHVHIVIEVNGVSMCNNTTLALLFHLDHSVTLRLQPRIIAVLWTSLTCSGINKVNARHGDVRDDNEIRVKVSCRAQ